MHKDGELCTSASAGSGAPAPSLMFPQNIPPKYAWCALKSQVTEAGWGKPRFSSGTVGWLGWCNCKIRVNELIAGVMRFASDVCRKDFLNYLNPVNCKLLNSMFLSRGI